MFLCGAASTEIISCQELRSWLAYRRSIVSVNGA